MLKVFLVEDEVVMRNGIKNSIPWEKEGFQFVGEASDGELAYPLIKKEKPDILITDIQMPFMDGLELSRLVKNELPNIKIIILSGYNEFDYAKTAISIGVTDYLLKPIGSAKLLEAIKKVGEVIENEQKQKQMIDSYRQEMNENLNHQKHDLWINLISDQLSMGEMLEAGQKVGMDFTAAVYQVLLFKVFHRGYGTEYSGELASLTEKIEIEIEQWDHILSFDRSPEGWAFLIKGNQDEEVEDCLEKIQNKLEEMVQEYAELSYFGGIGSKVYRLRNIRQSYLEAGKAFATRFFGKNNRFINSESMEDVRKQENGMIDAHAVRSKTAEHELINSFLRHGTLEEVDNFVGEYFRSIGEQNYQSLLYRQYITMDIFFATADFLRSLSIGAEEMPEELRDINTIVAKASGDELQNQIIRLFEAALNLRDNSSRKRYNMLINEAKSFIDSNYQREDMSLNMVASKVNITPSYFSTIFSAETGETFVEYLTRVRMEKAKELLMCSTMRTSEIGYEVGYKDGHYFSYIFKKVVGCSPKEFRNRGKE
ncbi:MAG: response regulator [Eubacteriales bacterium]|nr:response regulator [Eubacteriales bacterium]